MSGLFPEDNKTEFEGDLQAYAESLGIPIGEYGIPKVTIYPVNNNPILSSGNGNGILSGATPMPYIPPSTTNGVTQNRRDQSVMSLAQAPSSQIGLNEMLVRMGSAGLGEVGKGGTAQMAAIGNAYADVQEANRKRGLDAYNKQMELMADDLADNKDNKPKDYTEQIMQIDQSLDKMDDALQFLSDPSASVTGVFDTYVAGLWDRMTGGEDEARRMLLSELRVDDALLRIAQTKGAISNKEMDLFLAPAPSMGSQESVWISWINRRQRALRNIRNRLASGQTVDDPASENKVIQHSMTPVGGNSASMSEADAIVGIN